jgi:hypothetical protein
VTELFSYSQHKRVAERAKQGPPTVQKAVAQLAAGSASTRFNNKIGLGITKSVGTMWAAYAFAAISLVSLPAAIASASPIIIVAWIAQTFLQLVLLPIIIVGQNIQAAAADARSSATYDDAGAILEEAKQIQVHLASQDTAIGTLLDKVLTLEGAVATQAKGTTPDAS